MLIGEALSHRLGLQRYQITHLHLCTRQMLLSEEGFRRKAELIPRTELIKATDSRTHAVGLTADPDSYFWKEELLISAF